MVRRRTNRCGRRTCLFNGGVFKADVLRQRLLDVLGEWFGPTPSPSGRGAGPRLPSPAGRGAGGEGFRRPQMLEGRHDLDHAVARGAAYYGWAKHRGGVRIRGGTARAYYVGIETAGLAVPGAPRPLRALCVVPNGMEEGSEADVPFGRDRPDRRRAGAVPLFQFLDSQVRPARRLALLMVAGRIGGNRFLGGHAPGRRGHRRRLRARALSLADHGTRRAGVVVREHERAAGGGSWSSA